MAKPSLLELIATCLFVLALLHTFSVKIFLKRANRFPEGSTGENFFHLLGEIEVVFGIWGAFFFAALIATDGFQNAVHYLESRNFTEPLFVFAILTVCATRPILHFASASMNAISNALSKLTGLSSRTSLYLTLLIVGPLLGSLITEPAAMTVTALLLRDHFYTDHATVRLRYMTLATLFVNVSIGGTLTSFAAPPVLMVASVWDWDLTFMFTHFGWKAATAVAVNAMLAVLYCRKDIEASCHDVISADRRAIPAWLVAVHLAFLAGVVLTAHHAVVFMGFLLFFLGVANVTREYQDSLKMREGLLVGFFLAGLVVLGGPQAWWLEPLLSSLGELPLFIGATLLTGITDNAALTYLGAQVPNLSDGMKYALVSGAVAGGGLTVIANAPNPAGYSILNLRFGPSGISPLLLLKYAALPTLVAASAFLFL